MLRFTVFNNGRPAEAVCLEGAYLVGTDGVPIRAELSFSEGEIRCNKRVQGPAGLALPWPVRDFGSLMMETTRLVERETPYNLHVELARGRLMRISQKREDWGLYDYPDGAEYYRRIDEAKAMLVEALTAPDEPTAAEYADAALSASVAVGEDLGLFHADIFLKRRRATGQFVKRPFGAGVALTRSDEAYRQRLLELVDFASLPVYWRELEPKEGKVRWDSLDLWVNWLAQHRLHVRAGPLFSLELAHLPDWLARGEPEYDQLRDAMAAHALRLVRRFTHRIQSWEVISGIHACNTFHYSLEQLMDLTRTATQVVKQNAPRSSALVTIVVPWGEYYARDQRTIPPLLYADMCVQSGFNFDAFGLQFQFGAPVEGMLVRDMMQISSLIDRFANFGKPLHITAVQVPSAAAAARQAESPIANGGIWHEPWSEAVQARWVRQFYEIAFSKPFVETVAWRDLADAAGRPLPSGGVIRADLTCKPAYDQLLELRRSLLANRAASHSRA